MSSSLTRSLPWRLNSPWMISGSATMSLTGILGFSEAYGSWNTTWRSRRMCRICLRVLPTSSSPSNLTDPEVGGLSWRMALPVVDLPQPDSPTSPRVSPRSRWKVRSQAAWTSPIRRRTTPPPISG